MKTWDDVRDTLYDGTPEQIAMVRCPECGGELKLDYCNETKSTETLCLSCGTLIREFKSSYVPNYLKTTMLVEHVLNITGRGKHLVGDIKNGDFRKGDKVEILRNNEVIGLTVVNALEMFSTLDRKGGLAIRLQNVDDVDLKPGDFIRSADVIMNDKRHH